MNGVDEKWDLSRMGQKLVGGMRRVLEDRVPERWQGHLGLLRGVFVKDAVEQLSKIFTVVQHLGEYRRIDQALLYHRYASNLLLAYRLGIFEVLGDESLMPDEVARRCAIKAGAAAKLLQILESQKLVHRRGERFQATEFSRQFFDPDSAVSMAPMFEVSEAYAQAFPQLVEGAHSGVTPPILDVFEEAGRTDALLDGVNYYLAQAGRELIARVQWPEIRHIIVGSMGVSFSSLVLSAFPQAQVTYGCLPHLVQRIPGLCKTYGVDPAQITGMHDHGGEPADDRWGREAFDLVFLTKKMILDPDNGLGDKFARKAYQVLNPGGVAVFWETIYDDDGPTPMGRGLEGFLDFGVSPTGPVLRRRQFREQLEAMGYCDVDVVCCLQGATTFVVARKS